VESCVEVELPIGGRGGALPENGEAGASIAPPVVGGGGAFIDGGVRIGCELTPRVELAPARESRLNGCRTNRGTG